VALGAVFQDNPNNLIVQLFGDSFENTKTVAAQASPVNHVAANAPPFLFIHGDKDDTVPLDQSFALDKLLRENGTESRIIVMKGRGHAFSLNRQNLDEAQAFFARTLLGTPTD
jgi:dipeptidyl aminopeptidase/acylaminoacyl peptidase